MLQPQQKLSAIQKQLEYWRAYGMHHDPFANDSVSGCIFFGEEREELLATALQLACCATQAVVFYGPQGIGKTTFLNALEARLEDDEQIVVVTLAAGRTTTPQQLLAQLGQAFDLCTEQLEPAEIEVRIKERLQANDETQSKLVILVDDADQLPEFTLASLLVMARYPDNYISVLLFAATDSLGLLRAELQNQEIQQFEIAPFDAFTLESYLRYRLDLVGGDRNFPFSTVDIDDLLAQSRGIPQQVDKLARQQLQAALQPLAAQASIPAKKRGKRAAIRLPVVKVPKVTMPKLALPKIAVPWVTLPAIKVQWQPLAAVTGLAVFIGGAWLLSGGSQDPPMQPTITSAPARAEPQAQPTAAELPAADGEWIDRALALSPAAGKHSANPVVDIASIDSQQAQETVPTASKVTEPATVTPQPDAKLATITVKQKYVERTKQQLPADEVHLLEAPSDSYTLQLLGSSSRTGMRDFVQDNKNVEILVFEEELKGRPWFVAVTGSFESVELARDGLAELPSVLRKLKPWPRRFSSVHDDIKRYRRR